MRGFDSDVSAVVHAGSTICDLADDNPSGSIEQISDADFLNGNGKPDALIGDGRVARAT